MPNRDHEAPERARRRIIAERDIEILSRTSEADGLAGLAEYAAGVPLDDLD